MSPLGNPSLEGANPLPIEQGWDVWVALRLTLGSLPLCLILLCFHLSFYPSSTPLCLQACKNWALILQRILQDHVGANGPAPHAQIKLLNLSAAVRLLLGMLKRWGSWGHSRDEVALIPSWHGVDSNGCFWGAAHRGADGSTRRMKLK